MLTIADRLDKNMKMLQHWTADFTLFSCCADFLGMYRREK